MTLTGSTTSRTGAPHAAAGPDQSVEEYITRYYGHGGRNFAVSFDFLINGRYPIDVMSMEERLEMIQQHSPWFAGARVVRPAHAYVLIAPGMPG